eukprot:TRINITY_DN68163_c4_g1_i2.p1 TRINITY_DN68163_c4_g1~~TRINITY_DN68163_c4_g1_i2.p1  ORF type:complete len:291 (+),score=32.58 TRINITY_DN68163_c4_g1_i2:26-898(+)
MATEKKALQGVIEREAQRKEKWAQRQAEKEQRGGLAWNHVEEFSTKFTELHNQLNALIEEKNTNEALQIYKTAQQLINESSSFVPVREIQRCNKLLQAGFDSIQKCKGTTKKRFAFSRKDKVGATPQPKPAEKPAPTATSESSQQQAPTVEPSENKLLELNDPQPMFVDVLKQCTLINTATVNGAAWINNSTGCIFVLDSHQLRIHNTKDCIFYIKCGSDPIIEHCTNVQFAPHPDTTNTEDWVCNVKDFNWLKHTPSPNWCVREGEKRHTMEQLKGTIGWQLEGEGGGV